MSNYRKLAFQCYPAYCDSCGWEAYPEVLEVHHVDHNRENNAQENLRILCPTCHRVTHYMARGEDQVEWDELNEWDRE